MEVKTTSWHQTNETDWERGGGASGGGGLESAAASALCHLHVLYSVSDMTCVAVSSCSLPPRCTTALSPTKWQHPAGAGPRDCVLIISR